MASIEQRNVMGRWLPSRPAAPIPCGSCAAAEEAAAEARQSEREREARKVERERREGKILQLLHGAGASPWEHGHATLESFDTSESGASPVTAARVFTDAIRQADRYEPVQGLYLHGTTGSGKSHLATAIARELLLEPSIPPDEVVFDAADVLVSRIRSLYGGRGDVDAFLQRREKARVWILDDLGREPPHPDVVGHLTMLISQRSMRGTVITGNPSPEEYETRHPDLARIGSRLGSGYFRVVEVNGRDRRWDRREASR